MLEAVAPFAYVDVTTLATWLASYSFEEWPQQRRRRPGQCRPAMINTDWRGMYARSDELVRTCLAALHSAGWHVSERSVSRMLSVVMPGDWIAPHVDHQPEAWRGRVHVPLITNPAATFTADGVAFRMDVGTAYLIDTQREHEIRNDGDTPRVHFMFDIVERH